MLWFSGKDRPELPEWWLTYHQKNRLPIRPKTTLDSLTFSVIDIETTGLDPMKDSIITFAAIRIQNRKILVGDSLEIIFNQNFRIDTAIPVHELTRGDKEKGMPPGDATAIILNFIGNTILVGFHIQFDCSFINQLLKKLTGNKLMNPCLDLYSLIRRIEDPVHTLHPAVHKNLGQLCQAYGVEFRDPHTAGGDAFATAQLFLKVLNQLNKRGIDTWRSLRKR